MNAILATYFAALSTSEASLTLALQGASTSQLVEVYNAATKGSPVKKFSDKKVAIRRTFEAIVAAAPTTAPAPEEKVEEEEAAKPAKAPKAAKEPKAPKAPKAPKEPKERKVRQPTFNMPRSTEELKEVREGTHRHTLVQMLSRKSGATFDECLAATWGKDTNMDAARQRKTTYEAIRLLNKYCGFGLRMEGERIHLVN